MEEEEKKTETLKMVEVKEYEKGMNDKEAAKFLGVSVHTLRKRRVLCMPPAYFKIGEKVIYKKSILEEFLLHHYHRPKVEYSFLSISQIQEKRRKMKQESFKDLDDKLDLF